MKRIITVITYFFITVSTVNASIDKVSNLFIQYLQQVHKIELPPQNATYIVINLLTCPSCLKEYIPEIEKIYGNTRNKFYPSLIVVGKAKNPPEWFNKISKNHKNIYYDSDGFYNKINVTPNNSGIVIVKDGKIVDRKIILMENYKEIFGSIK